MSGPTKLARWALWATCACAAVPAFAQSIEPGAQPAAGTAVDDIVVTARKRAETIVTVPASVSAFSAEQLKDLGGVKSITDLGYLLPGISFINTGNINSEINIRGAGSGTARTSGVDSPIAVLKDDVSIVGGSIGGRTYTIADLFDLERIEVTRGPQGALYGVNAVGGVMNVISTRPRDTFGFSASADYSFDIERYAAEAIINIPLTSTVSIRGGYQHSERRNGFFHNVADGKAGDIENYDGGRGALLWKPSTAFTLYATIDASDELSPSNRVKSVNVSNDATGLTPTQIPPPDIDGPFLFGANTSNVVERKLVSGMLRLEAQAPFGKLVAISLARHRKTDFFQDEDGSFVGYAALPFPAAGCATRVCTTEFFDDTKMYSQEIRALGDISHTLDYLVGLNVAYRSSDFATISNGRTISATNLGPSPSANQGSVSNDDELQYGVFGDIGWHPSQHVSITAAGRYNFSEKHLDAYNVPRATSTGIPCNYLNPIYGQTPIGPPCVSSRAQLYAEFENFAPSISAQYKFTPKINVYATVAVGYRAGGFNGNAVLDTKIPQAFDPEKSLAYEAGAKAEILGARLSVAAFYNDFKNLLVSLTSIGADNLSRNYRFNAGKAETHGVDFEADGRIPLPAQYGRLSYTLAFNWLDGKILDGIYAGKTVEGSPEFTYTATGIYRVPLAGSVVFLASANYRAQRGGFFNTTSISNRIKNPDLDLVDARIGIENDRWRLEATASNLFNVTYETLRDPQRSVYGDPRTVLLRLSYRFGSEASR